ncbi:MAG: anti-sigma regulatory factor [Frankiales bacterium]|nr:anti-sigma regulatory factor [Frankiales bacterium]
MAVVELSFTPLPGHVRTARLIATAIARRADVEPDIVDEIRLAVGEACSRAVRLHQSHGEARPIRLTLSVDQGRFEVVVIDAVPDDDSRGPVEDVDLSDLSVEDSDDGSMSARIGLAVIVGLVDSVEVIPHPAGGTEVHMSWPSGDVRRDTVLAAEA